MISIDNIVRIFKNYLRPYYNIFHSYRYRATHKKYGIIYCPYYNLSAEFASSKPDIYNNLGEKMDVFFIRDIHGAHCPYGNNSKYFVWDRYNFGLSTHFYSHEAMLETMGHPTHRYGMLIESEAVSPDSYKIFNKYKGLENDFDNIFTYSEDILNSIANSKFYPSQASPWYGKKKYGGNLTSVAYKKKLHNISFMCSNKILCKMHELRNTIATNISGNNAVDMFGTFGGGHYVSNLEDVYGKYRYSIAIENDIKPYYFSERLTNCFASMTIPIYIGATKVDHFFNRDGIIQVAPNECDKISDILEMCSEEDYTQRIPAIIDNYNRVQKFINMDDWLYENYLSENVGE